MRPTIYVAGPYSPPKWALWPLSTLWRLRNVLRAAKAAAELVEKGWAVICPHSNSYFPAVMKPRITWETWLDVDMALLARVDALLYLGKSNGADKELKAAVEEKIPVYLAAEDVPLAAHFKTDSRQLQEKLRFLSHVLKATGCPQDLVSLCITRMERGHKEYKDEWLQADLARHTREEIADIINYTALRWAKGEAVDLQPLRAALAHLRGL